MKGKSFVSLLPDPTPSDHLALVAELGAMTTEKAEASFGDLSQKSTRELLAAMDIENQKVPAIVAQASPAITRAIDAIAPRLASGGRLIYVGAGTPGRIGILDASECPPTFGVDADVVVGVIAGGPRAVVGAVENAEDDPEAGRLDLAALRITANDAVVGISASGRTPYVLGAMAHARECGALTVGIVSNENSALGRSVDVAIDVVVGPELLAGSTRLKAGTAQKLVLNAISTISMVRLGKTYGNVMVDLKISNDKLRARAERTIMSIVGVEQDVAAEALSNSDDSVKVALLSIHSQLPPADARHVLESAGGHLQAAIAITATRS